MQTWPYLLVGQVQHTGELLHLLQTEVFLSLKSVVEDTQLSLGEHGPHFRLLGLLRRLGAVLRRLGAVLRRPERGYLGAGRIGAVLNE